MWAQCTSHGVTAFFPSQAVGYSQTLGSAEVSAGDRGVAGLGGQLRHCLMGARDRVRKPRIINQD